MTDAAMGLENIVEDQVQVLCSSSSSSSRIQHKVALQLSI